MLFIKEVCEISDVLKVIYFVDQLLKVVLFIVPMGLIVMLSVDFVKSVIVSDVESMKKNVNLAVKRIIMAIFLFLVPSVVKFSVNLLGDLGVPYADCLEKANLDNISVLEAQEKLEEEQRKLEEGNKNNSSVDLSGGGVTIVGEGSDLSTGTGMGKATNIQIKYNIKDGKGRCGKGKGDYCASVATVTYPNEVVKYYMGYQNNSGLLSGSCRSHAFIAVTNAIKETQYSTIDLQKYLYQVGYHGVLKAKGLSSAIRHYGLSAKVYHSEISRAEAASLIEKALNSGQPVMIFVANSKCSDLASTHHALLLLGYDKNNNVVFIDSSNYSRNAKKRTVNEISKCLSGDHIADNYYRMIIFSFHS